MNLLEGLPRRVGLLLSGGLDSAILLGQLVVQGHEVQPFYVRAGMRWENVELAAALRFIAALGSPHIAEPAVLELPLHDVYGLHWSVTGQAVPSADTPDQAVYLPGRNAVLLIKAILWCHLHGIEALALAPLATNPFPDATPEFFAELQGALNRGLGGAVRIVRPFAQLHKSQVMALGHGLPLELTLSCIDPVGDLHCGGCNKCAERQAAFATSGLPDPTVYFNGHSQAARAK